jgi:hypothetical protein
MSWVRSLFRSRLRFVSQGLLRPALVTGCVTVALCVLGAGSESALGAVLIDPAVFRINPAEEVRPSIVESGLTSVRVDLKSLTSDDETVLRDSLGKDKEDINWCLWSGLSGLTQELASGEEPNIDEALEGRFVKCLTSYFAGKPESGSIYWVAKALTLRDNLDLFLQLGYSEEEAWNQVIENKFTLSSTGWQKWFERATAAVPPVS